MKRNNSRQAADDQASGLDEEDTANGGAYDAAMSKFSANCYERRGKLWVRFNRGDLWIAVGLYLIMSSVAFVVL